MSENQNNPILCETVSLGIVCPMANEEKTAEVFVRDVLSYCKLFKFKTISFFAILDKVSKDDTLPLLKDLSSRVKELKVVYAPENTCVVDAYLRGYSEALGNGCDWILEIDAGYTHLPSQIPLFFQKMSTGQYDCVFGSRFMRGSGYKKNSLKRFFLSFGGTALTNLLLGTRLKDMTSGFELFSSGALREILKNPILSKGPFFQTEIKTHAHALRICEVPITYSGASYPVTSRVLGDALKSLWNLFLKRLRNGKHTQHRND